MDESTEKVQEGLCATDADFRKLYSVEGISTKEDDMQEMEIALQALTEIDFRLAYFSEKLMNLHVLYIYLLARENDLEAIDTKDDCILANFFERAMTFDLLSGILDSEVRELDNFMDTLQEEIVDARRKIFSCRHLTEVSHMMEEKLLGCEESMKQFQQQLLELKMQSTQLQKTIAALKDDNCKMERVYNLLENSQLIDMKVKSSDQMVEQRKYLLRMLEKSLVRELDLEKKLVELRKNEELKLKLHYTEQVAFRMEEAAEVVWGRFLEADNAVEVLMGISKGLMGRLQLTEFNLNGSIHRENELKSKIQDFIEQVKDKDAAIEKLERCNAENMQLKSEVLALKEKVKLREEEQRDFELRLNSVIAENETSQEQLIELENLVVSLKESVDIAENRAETAEAKVTQLTETNMELNEELNFHKGSASAAEKKVGSLEKQLRELDSQLQNAKASSEASQEQQNMLYTAIWDMEILIEELKSKASKAESKKESAEEQCIVLSNTILELNKELDLLRSSMISMKLSLDHACNSKLSSAKEIDTRSKFIMDMIMQLAAERERINKQLHALRNENKCLVEKLQDIKIGAPLDACNNGLNNRNEDQDSNIDSSNGSCTKSSDEEGADPLNNTFKVGEQAGEASSETQAVSYISSSKSSKWRNFTILLMALIIIPLVSVLAFFLFDNETFSLLKASFDG
ncbi:WPP domain-interacting tail-anchored protein 2 isoform X1 [Arachis hypogaea]|uniref:WPP domain-interacting tail-anchored protein 2 isoform X1 n=2 Tax=Arachis hypogaea TaxID=3818 RepID=UPI000DEC369F|nr:WPP domain-interacting tail-anchored protein 2 isoform X1 [Arachis hypogaea]QHO43844.1 WPP domain-interacting tail-anchored protein [Arachis hypogaea]